MDRLLLGISVGVRWMTMTKRGYRGGVSGKSSRLMELKAMTMEEGARDDREKEAHRLHLYPTYLPFCFPSLHLIPLPPSSASDEAHNFPFSVDKQPPIDVLDEHPQQQHQQQLLTLHCCQQQC